MGSEPRADDVALREGSPVSARVSQLRRLLQNPLASIAIAAGLAFAAAAATFEWATYGGPTTIHIEASFSKRSCCNMEIWLDGIPGPVVVLPIQPGTRAVYATAINETRVDQLGIKIGDVPKTWAVVDRVWVTRGARTISVLPRAQLARFATYLAQHAPAHGRAAYAVQGANAMLNEPVSLSTGENAVQVAVAPVVENPIEWDCGLVLFGAILIVGAGTARRNLGRLAGLALALSLIAALPDLVAQLGLRNDVSQAVSYASFVGASKPSDQLLLELALGTALAIGLAAGFATRFLSGAGPARTPIEHGQSPRSSPHWNRKWVQIALIAVPLLVVALLAVPDLRQQVLDDQGGAYPNNWDENNAVFWTYLLHRGLSPVRDFFYPYGFQYLFSSSLEWGPVLLCMNTVVIWLYILVGAYAFLRRSSPPRLLAFRYVALLGLVLTFVFAGFSVESRYLAGLGPLLLFASLGNTEPLLSWRRALFVLALTHVALYEFAQAVYALVPIAFIIAVDSLTPLRSEGLRAVARGVARSVLMVACSLAIATLALALSGRLAGTVMYYRQLSAVISGYGYPADAVAWIRHPTTLASFLFWCAPLAVVLGAYGVAAFSGSRQRANTRVVALGVFGFMMMQKQIVRPGNEAVMWLPSVFGVLVWATIESSRTRIRHTAAFASVVGVIVALGLVSGTYESGLTTTAAGTTRLGHSVSTIATDAKGFARATRVWFSPSRFAPYYGEPQVVGYLKRDAAVRAGGRVWVLGDAALVVMLLDANWPYYFSELYDESPLSFQRKTLHQLEQDPPRRVVWNFAPSAMSFDDVPNVVRSPMLFVWTIRHYEPATIIKDFAVLRPRRRAERIDLAWWRRRLGTTLDVGLIPEDVRMTNEFCLRGPSCRTYLVVTPAAGSPQPPDYVIPVTVDGLQFSVRLETQPGVRRYVVDLSQAWFWAAAPASAPRSIASGTVDGAAVEVTKRLQSGAVLY